MKLTVKQLRRLIREDAAVAARPDPSFIAVPLNDLLRVFVLRMRAMFPHQNAQEAIKREANELKSSVLQSITAAAKSVKASVGAK